MTDTKRRTKARACEFDGPASENYKTLFQETAVAAKYRSVLLIFLTFFLWNRRNLY